MQHFKRIYDSVHGFIYFSSLERDLIDSYAFQRLHYLHQVGVAYLVYPGATHTRFEHSLGVMHVATQIFDQIMRKYEKPLEPLQLAYWRQVVRFAALCHDLGHLPFSHTAEKVLLEGGGHEKWTLDLIESAFLRPVWDQLQSEFPGAPVIDDIIKLSLGEKKLAEVRPQEAFTPWQRVLTQVITGDFFGADRIDYLLRDARATGVSYGLFDYQQLIEMLRILPSKEGELTLGIEESGIESCEALLLARHFMHRRVYQYPSVKAYSFHMARFLKGYSQKEAMLSSLTKYLSYTDNEVLSEIRVACNTPSHPGHEDAVAILAKDRRYLAFELSGQLEAEEVEEWKKQCKVGSVEVHLVDEKKGASSDLFPVLSKSGKIVDARSFLSISIREQPSSWAYMPPEYEESAKVLLQQYPVEKMYAKN